MTAIFVEVTATRGSAPRDAGTAMKVTPETIAGTIGGGALEHQAIAHARQMLAEGRCEDSQTLPLGPGLGQCCGGAVSLRYTTTPRPLDAATPLPLPDVHSDVPLWLWGAGHVGRAVVAACPPRAFEITWIDSARDRFPDQIPPHVTATPAADMPRLAAHAPREAHHLIWVARASLNATKSLSEFVYAHAWSKVAWVRLVATGGIEGLQFTHPRCR